jgi:hypothetical protein
VVRNIFYFGIVKGERGETVKSKYESHVVPRLDEIKAWVRDGVNNKDIAHNLGLSECTIYDYVKKYPEFAKIFTQGRAFVDDVIVVNAYLRRVTGYDALEYKREFKITHDAKGNEIRELVKITELTRHIPADPRACEFWLTNRQPDKWKYPQKIQAAQSDDNDESGVILLPSVEESANGKA